MTAYRKEQLHAWLYLATGAAIGVALVPVVHAIDAALAPLYNVVAIVLGFLVALICVAAPIVTAVAAYQKRRRQRLSKP